MRRIGEITPPIPRMQNVLNAMSIDVEDYFQVSAFNNAIDRLSWDDRSRRVDGNTRGLLEILDGAGIKATFFVLGWVAEREPALVKAIAAAGHEIASHGYSHKLIYTQAKDEFSEETRKSKIILEDLVQSPVTTYRAASYSITRASLWALDVLYEAGFRNRIPASFQFVMIVTACLAVPSSRIVWNCPTAASCWSFPCPRCAPQA